MLCPLQLTTRLVIALTYLQSCPSITSLRYLVLAGHVKTNGEVVEYWLFWLKTIFAEYTIYIEVWKNSSLKNAYVEAGSCGCGHLGEVNLLWDGSLGRSGEVEPNCLELERGRRFRLLALNGKKLRGDVKKSGSFKSYGLLNRRSLPPLGSTYHKGIVFFLFR